MIIPGIRWYTHCFAIDSPFGPPKIDGCAENWWESLEEIKRKGLPVMQTYEHADYEITRMQLPFVNPETRNSSHRVHREHRERRSFSALRGITQEV